MTSERKKINESNYKKMMAQLEIINKMVDEADGKIDNLPMLGESIPELLELSDSIRQDDSDF